MLFIVDISCKNRKTRHENEMPVYGYTTYFGTENTRFYSDTVLNGVANFI